LPPGFTIEEDAGVGEPWKAAVIVGALLLALVVPRWVLKPKKRPWQIWVPAAAAAALLVSGLITRYWLWVSTFGIVLPIEIWRTLPA
jgi:hypothetical protein